MEEWSLDVKYDNVDAVYVSPLPKAGTLAACPDFLYPFYEYLLLAIAR